MKEKILSMMAAQAKMNDVAYPGWRDAPPNYALALTSECMEFVDGIGWKWWKHHEPRPHVQSQLEVVDMWHFVMSMMLLDHGVDSTITRVIDNKMLWQIPDYVDNGMLTASAHALILSVPRGEGRDTYRMFSTFVWLMSQSRLSLNDLAVLYAQKAALNYFRWSNGYKEGTYIKDWLGEEDNEYLEKMVVLHPHADIDALTKLLKTRYDEVLHEAVSN